MVVSINTTTSDLLSLILLHDLICWKYLLRVFGSCMFEKKIFAYPYNHQENG